MKPHNRKKFLYDVYRDYSIRIDRAPKEKKFNVYLEGAHEILWLDCTDEEARMREKYLVRLAQEGMS